MKNVAKSNPRERPRTSEVVLQEVDIAIAVRLVAHGARYYLSVRPRDIEFWGLKPGDEVLMKIVKVKRATPAP